MSLGIPEEKQFELAPADTHIATCYRVIDLGTQQFEWQGEVSRNHQIMLSWELAALMSDGKPFSIGKFYTYSFNEKANLRKDLESWRGRPFADDEIKKFKLFNLFKVPCLMGIVHENKNGKTKAKITSIVKLPKGMEAPPLVNPTVDFDLGDFNQEIYDSFPDGLKQIIAKSPEYHQAIGKREQVEEVPSNYPIPTESSYGAQMPSDEIPF